MAFEVIRAYPVTDINGIMSEVPNNPYLKDAVMTASPEQLQLMLYDGAIRFAMQGRDAIEKKDYETTYERLIRAQNILLEMLNGLNYDVNRELCERMGSIYMFIYKKLLDANIQHSVSDIDDALKVLRIERETWQMLVDKVNSVRENDEGDRYDPSEKLQTAPAVTDDVATDSGFPDDRHQSISFEG